MYDVIEKLLILQERDRRIMQVSDQLGGMEPERQMLRGQAEEARAALEAAKLRSKQIETERKKLELDAEAKRQQIEKYSLQQFQTKKNEEYKALAHEIETCRGAIVELEDQQLELMEQAETTQKQAAAASGEAEEMKKLAEGKIKDLDGRETALRSELEELEGNREQIKSAVDEGVLKRYERLLKMKGSSVVVGINHGVCGGCHMKFPVQLVVSCQAGKEIVSCPNCGRILYYTRDMDLAVIE